MEKTDGIPDLIMTWHCLRHKALQAKLSAPGRQASVFHVFSVRIPVNKRPGLKRRRDTNHMSKQLLHTQRLVPYPLGRLD